MTRIERPFPFLFFPLVDKEGGRTRNSLSLERFHNRRCVVKCRRVRRFSSRRIGEGVVPITRSEYYTAAP